MCLLTFSWKKHADYRLILLANRDEFYERKTQKADFWEENPAILAGKDLEAGGTWLGIHQNGNFTALTNYRNLKNLKTNAPSRGKLPLDWLESTDTAPHYLEKIQATASTYNGFNLLIGNLENLYYFSNYQNQIRPLEAGIYGLSNHLLDTDWFKVQKLKQNFSESIDKGVDIDVFFSLLKDTQFPPDQQVQQTGLSFEMEKMLSPIFLKNPKYGTCCSTVLTIDYNNEVNFVERNYNAENEDFIEKKFNFRLSQALL